jgi:hypothetical protein
MKFLDNFIKRINLSLHNIFDTFYNIFFEFRKSRKHEHSLKCEVLNVQDTGIGEFYTGITDEGNNILLVPMLLRVYFNLHPILVDGKKLFIVPSKYHGTLNIPELGKMSNALSQNARIKFEMDEKLFRFLQSIWKFNDHVINFEFKHISGTIDTTLFNNNYSSTFSVLVKLIYSTKVLSFLQETPNRVLILACLSCLVFGMFIGTPIGMILSGVILYFIK